MTQGRHNFRQVFSRLRQLCGALDDEAQSEAELAGIQHGDGDTRELFRCDTRRIDSGAQLLRYVNGQNSLCAFVRQPLTSWGFSIRANLLGFAVFRFDYTNPLSRPEGVSSYWTVSLGPTF